jgi:pyruvate formate lyase activating enzyme
LLDHTDLVLLDIKSWDRTTYKYVTGVTIDSTLAFAHRLERRGIPVWVRFVFVPGLTDDPENVEGLARFVGTLTNVQRVQVLPFHKLAAHKYQQLGIQFRLEATPTPTPEQLARARAAFHAHGVHAD